jgi:2,3-bisphosphoglycerate-dependent phosphoglycerate mutase
MTSFLRRAVRSACLLLSVLDQCWVPMRKDPTLNEVHCGILTGENKARLAEQMSAERVMAWRRNYDLRPPSISDDAPLQAQHLADLRYRPLGGPPTPVPSCESLADCCARLEPWWESELIPALSRGGNVLVVSHGNTLRAIVKRLEGISHQEIFNVDLPTAVPCVYSLNRDLHPLGPPHGTWGDPAAASPLRRRGRFLVSEAEVQAAQRAMRSQVLSDIAVTTATPAGASGVSTSPASIAAESSDAMVYRDGLSFRVRSRPPSYFTEMLRLEAQARREYGLLRGRQRALPARRGFKKQVPNTPVLAVAPCPSASQCSVWHSSAACPFRDLVRPVSVLPSHPCRRAWTTRVPPTPPPLVSLTPQVRAALVLVRHGYSEYNADRRFMGWAECELTDRGREEARLAGRLLQLAGVRRVERVYTSVLSRAIKSAWLMLDEMELGCDTVPP